MMVSSSQGIYNRIKNRKRDWMGSRWISMARVVKYVAVFGRDYLTKARKEIFLQLELVFFSFFLFFPFPHGGARVQSLLRKPTVNVSI